MQVSPSGRPSVAISAYSQPSRYVRLSSNLIMRATASSLASLLSPHHQIRPLIPTSSRKGGGGGLETAAWQRGRTNCLAASSRKCLACIRCCCSDDDHVGGQWGFRREREKEGRRLTLDRLDTKWRGGRAREREKVDGRDVIRPRGHASCMQRCDLSIGWRGRPADRGNRDLRAFLQLPLLAFVRPALTGLAWPD